MKKYNFKEVDKIEKYLEYIKQSTNLTDIDIQVALKISSTEY